jgi:hypothetical protein
MPQAKRVFSARTVTGFSSVLAADAYTPVPDDSWIATTDVAGSTEAIGRGRYKDVNLAGAAGIAAFANAFPELELPSFFGGDGATVLIPGGSQAHAAQVLAGLETTAQSALGLTLRTALTPVATVRQRGHDVRLAYEELAGGRTLAMLCGGGVAYAEALSKSPDGVQFRIGQTKETPPPNLDGLSCRWQPVTPQRGVMLTVLVQGPAFPDAYLPVFDAIATAAAGPQNPLARPPLPAWPPKGLLAEARLRDPRRRFRRALGILGESALGVLSSYSGVAIGGFNGRTYRDSLAKHCDALKFADGLKMVMDCTPAEADAVDTALAELPAVGGFAYGLQRSSSALMTCFVQTTSDGGHVHFVDGADGGYALAARQLKEKAATPA